MRRVVPTPGPDSDPDLNPIPWPNPSQVLRVCESMCDRLFQKCASANFEGRGRVDLTFSSGHQLCTAAGVRVGYVKTRNLIQPGQPAPQPAQAAPAPALHKALWPTTAAELLPL